MTPVLSNGVIADILERHGRLLEVAGESPFRTRAFERAAEALRTYPEHVSNLAREDRLREVPGIGEGIAAAIQEILATGQLSAHEQLTKRIPESVMDLLTVPGVGAKTALRLYHELGVDTLPALEAAVVSGRVRDTKGLGKRTEATILSGLEGLQKRTGRIPIGAAIPVAHAVLSAYSRARPGDQISLAGSARRFDESVGDLDFVLATMDRETAAATVGALPIVTASKRISSDALRLELAGGLQADVFFTDSASWGSALVRATGNAHHLERLAVIPDHAAIEEEVYAANGFPWIPPELRQGDVEFTRWKEIPQLVTVADINGELHAHTTWSDGGGSIESMAAAAAERGYSFLGITDHSHGLGVAGGLDIARLAAQRQEIAAADGIDGVKLLAGTEVEVHRDGALDFDDQTLAALDVVVASLHTGLRLPRADLMVRVEKVLENPNVDIIAHPTGRLIERREGGDFDWERVFAIAARTGTAMEINADPARLDLNPDLARMASAAGCIITINSDAHQSSGFGAMEYGVTVARKAWLKPEQILNCWPRDRVLAWLSDRGQPD